jgi:hypothetical protein
VHLVSADHLRHVPAPRRCRREQHARREGGQPLPPSAGSSTAARLSATLRLTPQFPLIARASGSAADRARRSSTRFVNGSARSGRWTRGLGNDCVRWDAVVGEEADQLVE